MRIEIEINLDDETLKTLKSLADFLELSLEDFIEEYLKSFFIIHEYYRSIDMSELDVFGKALSCSIQIHNLR